MSDIITGASSRTSESDTTLPMNNFPPKSSSEYAVCSARTIPMKSDVMATIDSERTPIVSNCAMMASRSNGPRNICWMTSHPSSVISPR